jgi:hypothetical protein
MKRNSRGMLSIIVLIILALSLTAPFLSIKAALGTPVVDDYTVIVGQVISVSGAGVIAGSTVSAYWDAAVGPDAMLLNTTTGKSNGAFVMDIEVPPTVNGSHYVWVTDGSAYESTSAITVSPSLEVDPESGLPDDTVTLSGTGFAGEVGFNSTFYHVGFAINEPLVVDNDEETDEVGSFSIDIDIPSGLAYDPNYMINVTHGLLLIAVQFNVGASITLTPDSGPEGTLIEIEGRGFIDADSLNETDITWDGWAGLQIVGDSIDIDGGEFTGEIFAPSWGLGDWTIAVSDGVNVGTEEFEIDGVSDLSVSPTFGPPLTTVTVTGANFTRKADEDVEIWFNDTIVPDQYLVAETTTDENGDFEVTFDVPSTGFAQHNVYATTDYHVNASHGFKIGIISVSLNPKSGPAGDLVSITGSGFDASGDYNMSIGGENVIEFGSVSAQEIISDTFYVPTLDPGTYTVTVSDSADNELATTFTVTEPTSLTADPMEAAVMYNVSLDGLNFANEDGATLEWIIYNSTTWNQTIPPSNFTYMGADATVQEWGNFTAYWIVPNYLELGGTYWLNVTSTATDATDEQEHYAQTSITIVPEAIEIEPNSDSYSLGEIITFTIKATFKKTGAELTIEDPDGNLIFKSTLNTWESVDNWEVVRYWDQVTDGPMNPFLIPSDASIGTWVWSIDDDDEVIANGTIEVLPTTAEQVDARLSDVEGSLADLSDDIAGVTSDLGDEIDALSSE